MRSLLTQPPGTAADESPARVSETVNFCRAEGLLALLESPARRGDAAYPLPSSVREEIAAHCRRQRATALRLEGVAAALQVVVDRIAGLQALFCGPLFRRHRFPGIPLPDAPPEIRLLVLSSGDHEELHAALGRRGFHPGSRAGRHRIGRRLLRQTLYRRNHTTLRVQLELAGTRLDRQRIWQTRAEHLTPQGPVAVLSDEYAVLEQLLALTSRSRWRPLAAFEMAELFFMVRALDATMDWAAVLAARETETPREAAARAAAGFLDALDLRQTFPALAAAAPARSAR